MAEMVKEKSTGLKFAEEQLLRHGWEKGKGLGRSENGIPEAIKVKVKCDKGGMGHKEGEQFSFHWWDHVFNKATSSLVVETGQSGVMVKKSDDSSDGPISNKKPRKAQQAKSMLYGCFVKSATLLSGEEQPEKTCDSEDDSSSSEDEDQKLDLSSTTKLSDSDLLKACGGRTAHKGARHGLTMSAKLARLEQQEQDFMNKYGKKNTSKTTTSPERHPDIKDKTKAKKSKRQEETSENNIPDASKDNENGKHKTRKESNNDMTENTQPKKKKKNRKEKVAPEDCFSGDGGVNGNETITQTSEEGDNKKKKKKKQSKVVSEAVDTDEISEDQANTQPQEGSIEQQQTSEGVSKKKKKKKKSEHQRASADVERSSSVMTVENTSSETQTQGQEDKKKKSKKKKRSKEQVEENEESLPKKRKSKE